MISHEFFEKLANLIQDNLISKFVYLLELSNLSNLKREKINI